MRPIHSPDSFCQLSENQMCEKSLTVPCIFIRVRIVNYERTAQLIKYAKRYYLKIDKENKKH
jgi:hypothetical protein